MKTVPVGGEGVPPYDVIVGRGLLAGAGERLAAWGYSRVAVVTDDTVAPLHGQALMSSLTEAGLKAEQIVIPAGEPSKSFAELERVLDAMGAARLDRKSAVVALGGGVVGDLAGLAGALYMRGVDVIQIPTTLLAQVDSSVGGKTAIDTPRGKNLVGAFHYPRLVLADVDLLATLSPRELRSGWAEVIKHGLLADADYFDWLEGPGAVGAQGNPAALLTAVEGSVRIKAAIVAEDPREAGRRALLNLGHTFGHALEAETGMGEALTHGEGVGLGCALAFRYSVRIGLCSGQDADRAQRTIAAAGLPTRLSDTQPVSADALLDRMAGDKKTEHGRLNLILAERIGHAVMRRDVDPADVRAFLIEEGAG